MANASLLNVALTRASYAVSTALAKPSAAILDNLFAAYPDYYRMRINGDERMAAIAEAIRSEVGTCDSLGDVSVYEGYVLGWVARELGVETVSGCDLSGVAVERARAYLPGTYTTFDLNDLYKDPTSNLPIPKPDVLLVCECLYYIGPLANLTWRQTWLFREAKLAFLQALRRQANKAIIVQHFGKGQKESIGELVVAAGGHKVEDRWGIWLLPAAT